MFHNGETFGKINNDWKIRKIRELIDIEELDFNKLKDSLEKDYRKTIKDAEEKGLFYDDIRLAEERLQRIIEKDVAEFTETYGTKDNPKQRKYTIH